MAHTQKNIKATFLAGFAYKVVCIDNNLARELFFREEKILLTNLWKEFLKSMIIFKK